MSPPARWGHLGVVSAGIVLAWALTSVAMALLMFVRGPGERLELWGSYLREHSLTVTGAAVVGLLLAVSARRTGARRAAPVAAALTAVALVLSFVPLRDAFETLAVHDVPLTVALVGSDPVGPVGDVDTILYARPADTPGGLRLDVTQPTDGAVARPAVVLVHGGSWSNGYRSRLPDLTYWLAARGFVVFDIDYRLAPPPRWHDAPGDVKCAVGWVKVHAAAYRVDPDRVVLMGYSAGGHLALLAAYTVDDLRLAATCPAADTGVAAVVAIYPITDLTSFVRTPLGATVTPRFIGAALEGLPEVYRLASPISHVDGADPPTYLAHGTDDRSVPVDQSDRLAASLQEVGVTHSFVRVIGADHGWLAESGSSTRITMSALERFLDQVLQ